MRSTVLLKTSMKSAGRYSCGYQRKDEKNQVTSSNYSAPLQLMVTGEHLYASQCGQGKGLKWRISGI